MLIVGCLFFIVEAVPSCGVVDLGDDYYGGFSYFFYYTMKPFS